MTTPPEARVYRISREESVLVRSQSGGIATAAGATAVAARPAAGPAANAGPAAAGQGQTRAAGPTIRVGVRKRSDQAVTADDKAGSTPAAGAKAMPEGTLPEGKAASPGKASAVVLPAPPADAGFSLPGTPPSDDQVLAIELAKVEAERLSPRQLRVAQRIARSHGIEAASDEEAVAKLRILGIDPLHRSALRKVVADEGDRASSAPSPSGRSLVEPANSGRALKSNEGLPAHTFDDGGDLVPLGNPTRLPSREVLTEQKRAVEIMKIQRDIARRRRRRMFMLFARIAAFVLLPTVLAGWYYYNIATPLYSTESQFQIQKADAAGAGSSLGSLFAGTQLATNTDSVSVQSYLGSRDAMLRLDNELGFKRVFQDPSIDPLLRLPPDASNEEAYGIYKSAVKVSYDPSEGVIGLQVQAPDPQLSQSYSLALIRYAEGQVDQMTARLREDQMTGAQESYNDAEAKVGEAQRRIQTLQEKLGVLDPASENAAAMSHISQLESELTKKELELGALQANARPNASRVAGVQGDIDRLTQMIEERRAQLTQDSGTRGSLAAVTGELRIAEGDLLTRQQLLAAAAGQMEAARIQANKQVRYLSLSVAPVPPDTASFPKSWQNTLVAFLIFSGIYLMLSLTASILREQVSS